MNLQLRDLTEPGVSLAEVLAGLATALVDDIRQRDDDPAKRIHDIRVGTKKIQGLLRLTAAHITPEEHEAARGLARAVRSAFSGERDEEVLHIRLKELLPAEDAAVADSQLLPAPPAAAPTPEEALAKAQELQAKLSSFDFRKLGRRSLSSSAAASYRKARKLFRSCRKKPEDDPMHTWRKRVKDVTYQALAMEEIRFLGKRTADLDALADALGNYHDLAVLAQRLGEQSPHAALVRKKQSEVGEQAFRMGAKLLRRSPKRFARKLAKGLRKHTP